MLVDSNQQKTVLSLLHKVQQERQKQQAFEKAIVNKQPGEARKLTNELTVLRMGIDVDLQTCIAICKTDQLKLF